MDVETPLRTDPAASAALLRENRALLIRHALEIGVVARFGAAWRDGYQAFMAGIQAAAGDPGRTARFRNEHFRRLHEVAGLAPYALVRSLGQSTAMDTLRAYFGVDRLASAWEHLVTPFGLWHANGPAHGMPYHQVGLPAVRAWILIHPESAGDGAPGLEFLPRREEPAMLTIEPHPTSASYGHIETEHAAVRAVAINQSTWTPIVRHGDVVLITGDCLVRTRFPEPCTADRFAILATFFTKPGGICCHFTPTGVEFPTDDSVEALARGTATDAQYDLIR
ncbi:MAG: hypothetical protein JO021_04180 [Alphaproteobacteria bacterium]|nr:hypothetical protein [Alphaproteobacteria bacterium]